MAAQTKLSESARWRNEGNAAYMSVNGLSPLLRCERLQRAINLYSRALGLAADGTDRSSACKNLAMASWRLAKAKMEGPDVEDKIVSFHFKEALKYFKDAETWGRERDRYWRVTLTVNALECWSDVKRRVDDWEDEERKLWEIQPLLGLLFHDVTQAREQYSIAQTYFSWALAALVSRDFKRALGLLAECGFPLNEALRLGKTDEDLVRDCRVLEEEIADQKCVAESIQARTNGDEILKMVTKETEDLSIDMVWEVVDWYRNAALLTRERDLELEAMALSALGCVYAKVLNLKSYAKPCLMKVVELVNTLVPRSCLNSEWYLFAISTLQQYQQDQVQADELQKQRERESIMKELTDDLNKLNGKFNSSSKEEFLKYVYSTHPPKNANHKLPDNPAFEDEHVMKKLYQKAVTHYHPDRVDEKEHGAKWKVLCEEITKLLSKQYQKYKDFLSGVSTDV